MGWTFVHCGYLYAICELEGELVGLSTSKVLES